MEINDKTVAKVLDSARRKLLDTGTRNRLIHVNRANSRANCLNIINESSDEVHAILRVHGKRMRFKAMGKDKSTEAEEVLLAVPDPNIAPDTNRLTDSYLETPLGPEALARRLLRLAGDAKTAEGEQGINILYLAMGFLHWRESPSSEVFRETPLVLLPVRLVRNERTSTFDIQSRDDDISTNLPFQERLRQDFGIALPELEEAEDWVPSAYFAAVRDAISGQPDWAIDADGMQLGFFSFAKLLMHRDLDPDTWPAGCFAENPLLRGLLAEGFPEDQPIFGPQDRLDCILDPAEIIQVIDADASQTKVIEEVRRGASLVVQGPPGTGKSQTITNIIAAAAYDGKTVLFVAEKMAALTVVHDRLVRSGLRDICLELHSRTANKKALAQELGRTLAASGKALPSAKNQCRLRTTRDELNRITALLHGPLPPNGDTPFRAIAEIVGFIGKGAPHPLIPTEGLEKLDDTSRGEALSALERLVKVLERAGLPDLHPFRGTHALDLQPTDLSRLETELVSALAEIDHLCKQTEAVAQSLSHDVPHILSDLPALLEKLSLMAVAPAVAPEWVPRLYEHVEDADLNTSLDVGIAWVEAKAAVSDVYTPAAWDHDLTGMQSVFSQLPEQLLRNLPGDLSKVHRDLTAIVASLRELEEDLILVSVSLRQSAPKTLSQIPHLLAVHDALSNPPARARELVPVLFDIEDKSRLTEALEAGAAWSAARQTAASSFVDSAWSTSLSSMRPALVRGQRSFLNRIFSGYRRASAELSTIISVPLPADPAGRVALVNELERVQAMRRQLADDEGWLQSKLAPEWRGERTAFSDILDLLDWLHATCTLGSFSEATSLLEAISASKSCRDLLEGLAERANAILRDMDALKTKLRDMSPSLDTTFLSGDVPLMDIRDTIKHIVGYYSASCELSPLLAKELPGSGPERLAHVIELAKLQDLKRCFFEAEHVFRRIFDVDWSGEDAPIGDIKETLTWLLTLQQEGAFRSLEQLEKALKEAPDPEQATADIQTSIDKMRAATDKVIARLQLDLDEASLGATIEETKLLELRAALAEMATELSRYNDWVDLARSMDEVDHSGASDALDAVLDERLPPERAVAEFAYACAEARWNAARAARPELNALPQLDRHNLVNLFRELERERIEEAKDLILSRHFEQMPKGTMGEMGVIRGEIGRKRGHKPIRWVMRNAGSMVQRIKPVMLMSPISVAQFLPPGNLTFDLLVIDEASQIRPEDALGVIARARQIVVVGDQKQLPPTSFFDRLVDDVDEDDDEEGDAPVGATAADMESILSLCEARGLRQRMLEWHYRSRDPSLIRVSNAEFYNDGLVLPPSPLEHDPDYGLRFRYVPGVYARGGSGLGRQGTNRVEAEAVAKALAEHARSWPDLSLGIVSFSKAQADMLTEVLELHRRQDPVLDAFLREGKAEDVFVKNIENVQGDERDVILISVGYGPQEPRGRLTSMSFGPVNSEGGERRLNVLFSRARVRCDVFASFDPSDIDPTRTKREGPRVLKRFLDFAKSGIMDEKVLTGLGADSPFEEDVAAAIKSLGYTADLQVGTAGFRVDIGVRHPDRPGQYLLAVECDGAAYHSALWARERDRLRQDILENLGWRFHRIWSTDWFHHRKRELERLREALTIARNAATSGIRVTGSNHGPTQSVQDKPLHVSEGRPVTVDPPDLSAPAYVRSDLIAPSSVEPHDAPVSQLADLLSQIVEIEGPIHIDEVARRITSAFGRTRTGNRIVGATNAALVVALKQYTTLRQDGPFISTLAQVESPPVRDRSLETGSLLKAAYLPPAEIRAAADLVLSESGEMARDDLIRAVARLLGFLRVGPDLWSAISAGLAANT